MKSIAEKFSSLATDNAPGQEMRQAAGDIAAIAIGERLPGIAVDFSHGDVDAFTPTPGSFRAFSEGVAAGGRQAYTEYRGSADLRGLVADRLAEFTGAPVSADKDLIITPGTQGALFLAMACAVSAGDKVAIVQPDYFANRKLVQFFDGEIVPVHLDYLGAGRQAGLNFEQLEAAFAAGAKVFVFSNPNNPTGAVYSEEEIRAIATLAAHHGVTVIVDQLYSRLAYPDAQYTHLRALAGEFEGLITIMGPSKTESLSGYRIGVAFGSSAIVGRMEKLQAIVSLRAAGYSQSVLRTWLREPKDWIDERIALHQAIRDELLSIFRQGSGFATRTPQAGSYLFPCVPKLAVSTADFVRLLRHQADVIVTPGSEFGPNVVESIRLNFSQNHRAAADAARRIVELSKRYQA
ncbi:aminotransferase class I/II-fold pyridoxal phosphate-dependent enzyme [Mesorhizobium sp. M7A.F.Ca.US.006.01.1.1]|uniref:pyridoxal phosphate-dependent aminotransferase n=1 Tax=Mesorhizobium sp. M7A.F.Ca.US.006.01.1.1 TaxID=2496707 RepID=UPI000FCA2F26|nr:pyridoxal phosphate-dependent aminotransferase [Mesorhizobium sp. M7A.F.Ca.US.006.01.1.1]RUZ75215.1 aminotransferase class I/II-fold pyridoxal phosphate-dependent enzyme [Mesorhizobium sp. M7A.F.Ca.US.006.01.1.1]